MADDKKYTIIVNSDNTLITTNKRTIMQRSKLVDNLHFLVPEEYGEFDMNDFTVVLEYITPVSKAYKTEVLTAEFDLYKDTYLEYILPIDTDITAEAGDVELQLSFTAIDGDVTYVRKTKTTTIAVNPITAWSDLITDKALTAIDQKMLQLEYYVETLNATANSLKAKKADNIKLETDEETEESSLYLTSDGKKIGDAIKMSKLGDAIITDNDDGMVEVII